MKGFPIIGKFAVRIYTKDIESHVVRAEYACGTAQKCTILEYPVLQRENRKAACSACTSQNSPTDLQSAIPYTNYRTSCAEHERKSSNSFLCKSHSLNVFCILSIQLYDSQSIQWYYCINIKEHVTNQKNQNVTH